jgi:hypothetical protein
MKNDVFLDATPCGSCKNRRAKVTSSLSIFTLKMEAIRSSETSVLTSVTRRRVPEDDILAFKTRLEGSHIINSMMYHKNELHGSYNFFK